MSSVSSGTAIENFTACCYQTQRVLYLKPRREFKLDFKLCKRRTSRPFPSPLLPLSCMGPRYLEGIIPTFRNLEPDGDASIWFKVPHGNNIAFPYKNILRDDTDFYKVKYLFFFLLLSTAQKD